MLNKLIPLIAGIVTFFFIQSCYWVFVDEGDYIDWGKVAHVEQKKYKAGDVFFAERTVTVRNDVYVTFNRRLAEINCQTKCKQFALPVSNRAYIKKKVYEVNRGVEIPDEVTPGKYVYEVTATWRVNPLRSKSIYLPPVEIEVIG